jgi:fused signal recognition particle receptor
MFGFLKTNKKTPDKPQEKSRAGLLAALSRGLQKTRSAFTEGLATLFLGKKAIDAELLEELETRLLMADVGVEATRQIIADLTAQVSRKELTNVEALMGALHKELQAILQPCESPLVIAENAQPFVILVVGVNGAGKTTTIGKLAKHLQQMGKKVMLAAGDTYRAAAIEQLQIWGQRNNVPVVAQQSGADSASVVYDALQAAKARGIDVLIADTAGRLHTQQPLMEELKKITRVLKKLSEQAPHEVMLVLDAGTGQNALRQAQQFHEAVKVTGITFTKLDGTAKGGIIFAIAKQLKLPIRFIGVGENMADLQPFIAKTFVNALFE